jgi:hypothetical protein
LHTCWLLILEEYGVTFEYLPGNKKVDLVADALPRLDIDSLKIQEETQEVLTLISGSENNWIINVKYTMPIYSTIIIKQQAKVKEVGLREKGLTQPHYLRQNIEGYDLLCYNNGILDLHSSIIDTE